MDRVLELDVDVIGVPPTRQGIRRTLERLSPLWATCGPDDVRGLVLNLGWVMDLVTEWSGDPSQRLPLRSRRLADWTQLTYADLGQLIRGLQEEAAALGLDPLRVGPMFIGVGEFATEIVRPPEQGAETSSAALYAERSGWYERHPELFPVPTTVTLHGPGIDPSVPLRGDTYSYATRPDGLVDGETFPTLFADQWRSLLEVVPFTLLHLRDEFTTPMHAGRMDHTGGSIPATQAEIDSWTDGIVALTVAIKRATPETLLILYSSGLGPTADLRFGRLDTHRLVAAGAVDVWIEQTWGGAWQDWWDATWAGWTFQLAYLLTRGAIIADADRERPIPCRRWKLIQALDGWEPYDTFHDYPGKLRWGIWAFSHAATLTAEGPAVAHGSYVAVLNDRTRTLMAEDDVRWLARELDAAEASAARLEAVVGPTLVHDRPSMRALIEERPDQHASEWVEEYVGLLLKWGLPVLSATTVGQLPTLDLRAAVLQVPVTEDHTRDALLGEIPALVTGRADLLAAPVRRAAGIAATGRLVDAGYTLGQARSTDLRPKGWVSMPVHAQVVTEPDVRTWYGSSETPMLTARGSLSVWQPPDWANPTNRQLPHYQLGGVEPHIEAARALHRALEDAGQLHVQPVPAHTPVSLHAWRSDGVHHLLVGNLESGWIGDARHPRRMTIHWPEVTDRMRSPRLRTVPDGSQLRPSGTAGSDVVFELEVEPEGCLVLQLIDTYGDAASGRRPS